MIKNIRIIFRSAVNKAKILECGGLSAEEASFIAKSDGYIRIGTDDYAIVQMVNNIFPNDREGTLDIVATVFLRKVTSNDHYLMK